MAFKSKGSNAERELVAMLWGTGKFGAIRVAGSGVSRFPCPDVLASNGEKTLAIECKAISDKNKYFSKKQISELKEFSSIFGAEPWIAVKLKNQGWHFFEIEDLEEIGSGNFVIKRGAWDQKAKKFFELASDIKQTRL